MTDIFFSAPGQKSGLAVRYEHILLLAILLMAVLIRTFRFVDVPGGLNQDEASMAYDAYATAFYGIDRNGFHFPVYAISWGSGQNTLYMYFTAVFIRIFGLSVFSVRLTNLLFGILSPVILYLLTKELSLPLPKKTSVQTALCAMLLLSVSPWHIMLSRWGLESNLLPGVFLIAIYLLVLAIRKKHTLFFGLAAGTLALSMYAYATVCIVMPIFVLGLTALLIHEGWITPRQLALAVLVFALVALPLILFYVVNIFGLPPIVTPFFSAPRLAAMRGTLAFDSIGQNIMALLALLVQQNDGLPWNTINQIGLTYLFMTPLAPVGVISTILNRKKAPLKQIMMLWLVCAVLLACVISINVNRINFIFIPLIYFIGEGVVFICRHVKFSWHLIGGALAAGVIAFHLAYFGEPYTSTMERYFHKSYDQAIAYADTFDLPIYSDISYTLVLFYTKPDPHAFIDTVVYTDEHSEFRPVSAFLKYRFGIPEEHDLGAVYIVKNDALDQFDTALYRVTSFQYYSVLSPPER